MAKPPWSREHGLDSVLDDWLEVGRVRPFLAAEKSVPPRDAETRPLPELDPRLKAALEARGVHELYSHQLSAFHAAKARRDWVVATPTASGKSLCFHLPVLDCLAEDPGATALFLYPTKALARDQEHGLLSLLGEAGLRVPSIVFDGDTAGDARRVARERGRIILTNPDMLHAGILPNHTKWASFLSGLRYVVLDELHTYRGVFGSHMAHVIARLRRVAAFHGGRPTFLGATATIGNPREHAAHLFGTPEAEVELIDQSGAPAAPREVFIYNPPIVNAELGVRASTLKAAVSLASDLIEKRVPTILFGPSRNSVEVMLKYLRDGLELSLRRSGTSAEKAIMGYRGGYLPEMRRQIEKGLRQGEILGVVATNALELGIDIGDLDAVICAGYPGSVAATWQRFGRAGRRGARSVAVLVCGSGAIDQYLAREPAYVLSGGAEHALVEPENPEIVIQHLKCALFEAPFTITPPGPRLSQMAAARGEAYGPLGTDATRDALEYLAAHGLAHASHGRYHWSGEAFPASNISLRSVGWDNFVIVDQGSPENPTETVLGELDYRATHTMLHEQAIYQQDAEQYQVERLDFENHKAFVRKVAPDYFTTALTYQKVTVMEAREQAPLGASERGFGDIQVIERVTGYKKIRFFTHENAGYGDVHLPEMEMHTTSFWLSFSNTELERLSKSAQQPRALLVDAVVGLGTALETVAALALMCDPRDIRRTLADEESEPLKAEPSSSDKQRSPESSTSSPLGPTLYLFDAIPGGVGLSARLFERAEEFLSRAHALIVACPCHLGCPACVGPTEAGPRKSLTLELMAAFRLAPQASLH